MRLEDFRVGIDIARAIQGEAPKTFVPPSDGTKPETQQILPHAMVKGTRGYIEKTTFQINGCYEQGWFDACAVMMRKLIETLIIETFEKHKIDSKIKSPASGDFLFLRDLIDVLLKETSWNLGRNTKQALPRLKNLGDLSAHGRRYNGHREDIDKLTQDFRIVCQELVYLASLR